MQKARFRSYPYRNRMIIGSHVCNSTFFNNGSSGLDNYLIDDPLFQAYRTYFLPVLILLGLCVNSLVIFGMARIRRGFSESTRLYYGTMAIAQLIVVIVPFLIGQFVESTLHFWSGGSWPLFLTINGAHWSCKLLNSVWVAADGIAGYTLVCLGIERSLAVTCPLRAKSLLSPRFSLTLLCSLNAVYILLLVPLSLWLYQLDKVPGIAICICTYNLKSHVGSFYVVLESLLSAFIPTFLSFLLTIYLTYRILRATSLRHRLSEQSQQQRGQTAAGAMPVQELSATITLVLLATLHLLVYAPLAVVTLGYLMAATLWKDDALRMMFSSLVDLFCSCTLVAHSTMFLTCIARSRTFRDAVFPFCKRANKHSVCLNIIQRSPPTQETKQGSLVTEARV